ncbi:putative porin [Pricia sp. S334]|uniref:Porin n=1 Tax=Pricia mediterranea TaxID=3076079 RepID=A0ABU3L348_9FLAO|nr:putative porin [Pricia sp. S334]MDT7828176.1 putative porin [Pricia sp. S334]
MKFETGTRAIEGRSRGILGACVPEIGSWKDYLPILALFLSFPILAQEDSIPPSRTTDSVPSIRVKDTSAVKNKLPILIREDTIPSAQKADSSLVNQKVPLTIPKDSVPSYKKMDVPLLGISDLPSVRGDSLRQLQAQAGSASKKRRRKFPREKIISPEAITIRDYKIISYARDTTYLDTTLTIQKEFKYNYLRRDNFELMPFANVGQPYNKLGVDLQADVFYPKLGATALNYNYMEVRDIDYYNVATPMSDLFFKTTFEEGQLLDATLTFNTSPRLNFSLAYKGFRSLGKYLSDQAESGNFRTTTNYGTRNGRYRIRAHIAAQDIETQANGGLINKEEQFEAGDPEFNERNKVDVRFNDADNKILGKRYYFDHSYKLLKRNQDSSLVEKTSLGIGHVFNYETKYYTFGQSQQSFYFGDRLVPAIEDKARLKTMYNQVNVEFYNATLGRLQGNLSAYDYNYFFNSILITEDGRRIPNRLKGTEIAIGAQYEKKIRGLELEGEVKYNVSGKLGGDLLKASVGYRLNDGFEISASAHASTRMPNFNYLLYQSDYTEYNWSNLDSFDKEQVCGLGFAMGSDIWGDLTLDYTTVDNYSYFGTDPNFVPGEGVQTSIVKPYQEDNVINHTKLTYTKEFRLGKFALHNTLMYQNVSQNEEVLNLPELVTRNTLYFSSDVFKKAMFLQTGITFKYFTAYTMDAYNPLLGEFYIQNEEKLGAFPMLDFFINAKVQQTRIYLKAEHFNTFFGETKNYYAAPNYPYRDFVIRFGLVWNFFS